jgi:NAD+ kinase
MLIQDPKVKVRHEQAHDENRKSADDVRATLEGCGLSVEVESRPCTDVIEGYDLVLTVGGDGTFLRTAQRVRMVPMLGVNSSVSSSVGRYCGAHTGNIEEVLDNILARRILPTRFFRLGIEINSVAMDPPVLNEVLYTHRVPAGTSRYVLDTNGVRERHKSSGVWIATPSGATGAIQSAGGSPMDLSQPCLQYLVREPYLAPGASNVLTNGIVHDPLRIENQMRDAALFVDGPRIVHELAWGDEIVLTPGMHPLSVYM